MMSTTVIIRTSEKTALPRFYFPHSLSYISLACCTTLSHSSTFLLPSSLSPTSDPSYFLLFFLDLSHLLCFLLYNPFFSDPSFPFLFKSSFSASSSVFFLFLLKSLPFPSPSSTLYLKLHSRIVVDMINAHKLSVLFLKITICTVRCGEACNRDQSVLLSVMNMTSHLSTGP